MPLATNDPSVSALFHRRWANLLAWLEGHGFQAQNLPVECREATHSGNGLFARSSCSSGSLLFAVPPKALMNKMTLKRLYPPETRVVKALTALQLISMHLFIWRPESDEDSTDPFFGPYISVLPRDFNGHPLTWVVMSNLGRADNLQTSLLHILPPGVLTALDRLYARFSDDWFKVRTFLQRMPTITPKSSNSLEPRDAILNFLWAWLNVNTRCIYYRLKHGKTDPDNLTMCPILDFANHTPGQAYMTPIPSDSEIRSSAPVNAIGSGLQFTVPVNVKIEEGDEILVTYGLHSNKTLFVEYGFVDLCTQDGSIPSREVDVQDLAEKYIFADVQLGEAVEAALVTEGYWGDWALYWTRESAQPSWRLITALRLYHLVVTAGSAEADIIEPWRDVVVGKRGRISRENEQSWRKTIEDLCDLLIERAEKSIASSSEPDKDGRSTWARWMSGNIQSLWREELFVARAVKESLLRGDEF